MAAIEPILRRGARDVRRADDDAARAALWRSRASRARWRSSRAGAASSSAIRPSRASASRRCSARSRRSPRGTGLRSSRSATRATAISIPIILYDRDDPAQVAAMEAADDEVVAAALALGGTITGEHGVGSEKRRQMRQRFSAAEIAAMRAVKSRLRPGRPAQPRRPPPRSRAGRTRPAPLRRRRLDAVTARAPRLESQACGGCSSHPPSRRTRRIAPRRREPHRHGGRARRRSLTCTPRSPPVASRCAAGRPTPA